MAFRHRLIAGLIQSAVLFGTLGTTGCGYFSEAPQPVIYTVVKGDTLFVIARDHDVSLDDLRAWNQIEGDLIEVGQALTIWPTGADAPEVATAEAKQPRKSAKPIAGIVRPSEAATEAQLELPPLQDCLAGPSIDGNADEHAMAASQGLVYDQISTAMRGFVGNTLPCITEGDATPEAALVMEITVGCNGRVDHISVLDTGDWPAPMAECVTKVLHFAPFPAHDLPDGETFTYPLRFTPG